MTSASQDKFFWSPADDRSAAVFVKQNLPTSVTDQDAPWIWVQSSKGDREDPESGLGRGETLQDAKMIMDNLQQQLRMVELIIQEDDSIPIRGSKGRLSKKQVRDESHEDAKKELKELSRRANWTVGKWLLFPKHDAVDRVWTAVALSAAQGPLKDAGVFLAKVASTQSGRTDDDESTHVISLYIPDVYDVSVVRKLIPRRPYPTRLSGAYVQVLEVLLAQHGLEPSAVKSDLYTLAGIDSNHPTKLRSSIWRPSEVLEGGAAAVKALKATYDPSALMADRLPAKKKLTQNGMINSDSEDERITAINHNRPAKRVSEGPAVSTTANSGEARPKKAPRVHAARKFHDNDIFAPDSD